MNRLVSFILYLFSSKYTGTHSLTDSDINE